MTWEETQSSIPWGTLALFGVGIGLGSALLTTNAAPWLATTIVGAYGTNTFEVRDFVRTGIPLTIVAYLLVLVMGATYWKWLGYVTS